MKNLFKILLLTLTLIPSIALAQFSVPFQATTTASTGFVFPSKVNGNYFPLQIPYIISTSTTATSTFANGINLQNGCFASSGVCISGGVGSGTQGQVAYYNANGNSVIGTSSIFIDTLSNVSIGTSSPFNVLEPEKLAVRGILDGTGTRIFSTYDGNSGNRIFSVTESGSVNINGSSDNDFLGESLLHLFHNFSDVYDPIINPNDEESYPFVLQNLNTSIGSSTGIGFTVTSVTNNIGGAIVFQRTGGNSQGKLSFYTKGSTVSTADPEERLTIHQSGRVGIGSTTPWAQLSVASTTYNNGTGSSFPLFAVATSSDNFGQLLTIVATTSTSDPFPTSGFPPEVGVRAIVGSFIDKTLDHLFINGRINSSWINNVCQDMTIGTSITANASNICGWMSFSEVSDGSLNNAGLSRDMGALSLTMNTGTANDAVVLTFSPTGQISVASTTPILEFVGNISSASGTTTSAVVGWFNTLGTTYPQSGCYLAATSSSGANWKAVCHASIGGAHTIVDTGIGSTTPAKFRIETGSNSVKFYAKGDPSQRSVLVANISTNIPTSWDVTGRFYLYRESGGTSSTLAMVIGHIKYWRKSVWQALP